MTEKLYEQDSMLKSCLATVLSCAEDKRGYAVVLDRTVFFPEGGGQLSEDDLCCAARQRSSALL